MIFPTPKLLLLLLVPTAALLLWPEAWMLRFVLIFDVMVVGLAVVDLAVSARPASLHITRRTPRHLHLGADNTLGWELHNTSRQVIRFAITEDLPLPLAPRGLPVEGRIAPTSRAQLHYTVVPSARGLHTLGDLHLRCHSLLGLLVRQQRRPMSTDARVYPNVQALVRYELAAQRHRLTEIGLTTSRQRGKGRAFESLRDYVPGDDLADMAWKASARRGRLITRNYETERSQNIQLVIDCGRLMTTEVDRLSRLDYAINASLLLTYVAVKQADYVGMLAFSDEVQSYVPLVKGRASLTRMNEALYRLEPRLCESDYDRACRFLALQNRKRSLIVIFTDVIDVDTSSSLITHAARFARRHLPLVVTMRNLEVERLAARRPQTTHELFEQSVAVQMLEQRARALQRMRRTGVDVLDVDPREASPKVLDRYLTLKQRLRM